MRPSETTRKPPHCADCALLSSMPQARPPVRNTKSARLSKSLATWLAEELRGRWEVETRTLVPIPAEEACADPWHAARSRARRMKRESPSGESYFAWEGSLYCPSCRSNHRAGESANRTSDAVVGGLWLPSVCTLDRRILSSELASVTVYCREWVPRYHVKDYIPRDQKQEVLREADVLAQQYIDEKQL